MNPDPLDNASEAAEMFLRIAMANVSHVTLKPTGRCYYCDSEVRAGLLFCPGGECSQDWEEERRRKEIAGKK